MRPVGNYTGRAAPKKIISLYIYTVSTTKFPRERWVSHMTSKDRGQDCSLVKKDNTAMGHRLQVIYSGLCGSLVHCKLHSLRG